MQSICNGLVAAIFSCPSSPPQLYLATVPADVSSSSSSSSCEASSSWQWRHVSDLDADLSSLPDVSQALDNLETAVVDVTPSVGDQKLMVQAIIQVYQLLMKVQKDNYHLWWLLVYLQLSFGTSCDPILLPPGKRLG